MPHYLKLGIGVVCLIAVASGLFVARSPPNSNACACRSTAGAGDCRGGATPRCVDRARRAGDSPGAVQVTGTLEKVDFTEGLKVKRGQVLAQIDPRTFQAALDQAIATRDRDQAQLDNAKENLGRNVPLLKRGYATGQQVDTQTAQVTQLQNTVKPDEAAIDAARTQLSYTTITAPVDGVTGIRLIDPGNIVHPNDPTGLVVVTQVQPITVIFPLPSADIPEVQEASARGEVKVDVYTADDKIELDRGRLLLIDNQADPTSGTVRLKAIFPNSAGKLWPGLRSSGARRSDGLVGRP